MGSAKKAIYALGSRFDEFGVASSKFFIRVNSLALVYVNRKVTLGIRPLLPYRKQRTPNEKKYVVTLVSNKILISEYDLRVWDS